jgi:phosphoribosyl 1,2-cyclic phosphodiesterase
MNSLSPTPDFCIWSLASGSSGNAFLIQAGETFVLLDAGYSAVTLIDYVERVGVDPARLRGILLTHEHSDHVAGVSPLSRKLKIPVYGNAATLASALAKSAETEARAVPTGAEFCIGELEVRSFPVHHDAAEPVGYQLMYRSRRICYLTDTGHLCPNLYREMAGAGLVILESNHDTHKLTNSPYPDLLKRRIMGDRGHLSNDAAAKGLAALSVGDSPVCVWLAHLSAKNNTPTLAKRAATLGLMDGDPNNVKLSVAKRDRPSLHWRASENWWQPTLFSF